MATFKDKLNRDWKVELDPILIEEIKSSHQINLVNLEADPLLKLRNDPMILVAVVYLICREQIEKLSIDPETFSRALKFPPDEMLNAVREAIIDFFPIGRASHVREALTKFAEMNAKTDELAIAKMAQVMNDPAINQRLSQQADKMVGEAIEELFKSSSSVVGSSITDEKSSM